MSFCHAGKDVHLVVHGDDVTFTWHEAALKWVRDDGSGALGSR